MPNSKALGQVKSRLKAPGMNCPASTKFWTKYSTPGKPANHTHRECWVFKQSGKLNAVHKGEDTPSEDEDEPPKQDTGEQKKFRPKVKTVNVLHVIKGKTTWHSQENIPKCLSPRSPATGRLNRSLSTIMITQQVSGTQDGLP